jgi:transketolase
MENLRERIQGFGVPVREVDGHDPAALGSALRPGDAGLRLVVLNTVKGKGVSFMEGRMEWHYLQLTDELYAQALRELGGG